MRTFFRHTLFLVKRKNSLLSKVLVSIGGRGSGSTLLVMSLVELVDLEWQLVQRLAQLFWYHINFVTERWYQGELSPIPVDAESWQGIRDLLDLMSKVCKESSFSAQEILLAEMRLEYIRVITNGIYWDLRRTETDNLSNRQKYKYCTTLFLVIQQICIF